MHSSGRHSQFESFVKSISYKTTEYFVENIMEFESFVKSISYKTIEVTFV